MKIIIYSSGFEPPIELVELAEKRKFSSIYDPRFVCDDEAVQFVESKLTTSHKVYLGRPNNKYRIGYAGFAQIIDVDPTRNWILVEDFKECVGYQKVQYVEIITDQNGKVKFKKVD